MVETRERFHSNQQLENEYNFIIVALYKVDQVASSNKWKFKEICNRKFIYIC